MESDLKNPIFGPYLCAAFFCEKILTEGDGVLSAIRIIDRITFQTQTDEIGASMPSRIYDLHLLLMFKTGESPGATTIRIDGQKPNPPHLPSMDRNIHLEQPASRGANLQVTLRVEIDQPGVWWFKIFVNNHERTRVPLEIVWLPQTQRRG